MARGTPPSRVSGPAEGCPTAAQKLTKKLHELQAPQWTAESLGALRDEVFAGPHAGSSLSLPWCCRVLGMGARGDPHPARSAPGAAG